MGEEDYRDGAIAPMEIVEVHDTAFGQAVFAGEISREQDSQPGAAAFAEGYNHAIGAGEFPAVLITAQPALDLDAGFARQDCGYRRGDLPKSGANLENGRRKHLSKFGPGLPAGGGAAPLA
jgi:hypothetical protein